MNEADLDRPIIQDSAQENIDTPGKQLLLLEEQSDEFWEEFAREAKQLREKAQREEDIWRKGMPGLSLDLDDDTDLRQKLIQVANYIYTSRNFRPGRHYDPYEGDMFCGPISDELFNYLAERKIAVNKVERTYEIKDPDGVYNDSFGHVYVQIDHDGEFILVDPTYLQWVQKEQRKDLPPVLVIRYRTPQELRRKLAEVPINKNPLIQAFYLGFDAPETLDFFNDSRYTVLSQERARIDD